jgi:thiamine-monophosphate kinase
MIEHTSTTPIEQLGEFGLIKHLTDGVAMQHAENIVGAGDDAAVIKQQDGKYLLVTTDMLLEGVHFDLSYFPLKHLGWKCIAANVSDIYAMNGFPRQATIGIGISSKFSVEAISEIYEGIYAACKHYELDLVGGDTTSSKQGLVVSITVLGQVDKDSLVLRSGAKEHDLLCVTGDLGAAYTGYQLLEREKRVYLSNPNTQPDLDGYDYIIGRQLKPEARKDIITWLAEKQIKPTSMIDISDGLSSEIFHLCEKSGVGMTIYEDKIPIDPTSYNMARELDLDPTMTALSGGEDYELLFTASQSDFEKLQSSPDITIIGHVVHASEGIHMISKSGNKHALQAQGWKAF